MAPRIRDIVCALVCVRQCCNCILTIILHFVDVHDYSLVNELSAHSTRSEEIPKIRDSGLIITSVAEGLGTFQEFASRNLLVWLLR
jgi:hypothetical protein